MAQATPTAVSRPNALVTLLDRYVAETVPDAAFAAVCDFPDDADATAAERLAFARFYLDIVAAGEPDVKLPRPEEIADVLMIARA